MAGVTGCRSKRTQLFLLWQHVFGILLWQVWNACFTYSCSFVAPPQCLLVAVWQHPATAQTTLLLTIKHAIPMQVARTFESTEVEGLLLQLGARDPDAGAFPIPDQGIHLAQRYDGACKC